MSPELIDPEICGLEGCCPTRESDCYALGMVIYEILSGCAPYDTNNPFAILRRVLAGERPKRPEGEAGKWFSDNIWDVVELCWKHRPDGRPDAKAVLLALEGKPYQLRSSDVNEDDVESDVDIDGQLDSMTNDPCMFSPSLFQASS